MSIFARPASELYTPRSANRLFDIPTDGPDGHRGYALAREVDETGKAIPLGGDTTIFRIYPHCQTEPRYVAKPDPTARFTVKALAGSGALVRARARTRSITELVRLDGETGDAAVVRPGDAYFVVNRKDTDLLPKREAIPAFQDGDEIDLTACRVISDRAPLPVSEDMAHIVLGNVGRQTSLALPLSFFDTLAAAVAGTLELH
jgi:hypothetical protein